MKQLVLSLGLCLPLAASVAAQTLPGPGNCYTFNGSSTNITGGNNQRGIAQQVTAEAWIRTSSSDYQMVVEKYSNSVYEEAGFHLFTQGGFAGFNGRAKQGQYYASGLSTTRVDDNRWHHLAGVFTGGQWRIYVDGVLENSSLKAASSITPDLTTTATLSIGYYGNQLSQYFNGQIDEVRVWKTARSTAQVQQSMCQKFGLMAPSDLVAYYRFDETTGFVATDAGSVPTNGTIGSAVGRTPSGAALGDISVSAYPSTTVSLTAASGDLATVSPNTTVKGVQLYAVNSAPSNAPGGSASTYFGVFTLTGSPLYKFILKPANSATVNSSLPKRQSADVTTWTYTSPFVSSTDMTLANEVYRAEYVQSELKGGRAAAIPATTAAAGQVELYPNPARRQLTVHLPVGTESEVTTVHFYNALGQRVFDQTIPAGSGTQQLQLPALKAGLYTVHVGLATGPVTQKLVIE